MRGSAIVLQRTKLRIGIVEVACTVETATVVATKVVTFRDNDTPTIPSNIIRDDAVLQCHGASVHVEDSAAPSFSRRISADRAVVDRERS